MKIKKNTNRLKRFRARYLSGKAAVLFLVNRKMKGFFGEANNFGRLTDIELRRREKAIVMEVTDEEAVNTIIIEHYGFEHRSGEPYLVWKKVSFDGPAEGKYRGIFKDINGIELSRGYFSLVEAVL